MPTELEQQMNDLAERAATHDALDFTPGSLATLEQVTRALHEQLDGMPDAAARDTTRRVLAVRLGAYLGEVLRRAGGGEWTTAVPPHETLPALRVAGHVLHPSAIMLEWLMGGAGDDLTALHTRCTS